MNQPQPQAVAFSTLLHHIETGHVKIPQFQREFVWQKAASAKLLDSILKGFPIGTFIVWETKETLRSVRNIGGAQLKPTPFGESAQYVLDGQQRLTSLYAAVRALKIRRADGREDDFSQIWVHLAAKNEDDVVVVDTADFDPAHIISLSDLLHGGLTKLAAYPTEFHGRIEELKKRLEGYQFSLVVVKDAPIEVATEIFTRINVSGKPLSVFEIMVAKTYDETQGFALAQRFEALDEKLRERDYEILPSTILQAVAAIITGGECQKRDILRIPKAVFIAKFDTAQDAIELAVDYLRGAYGIRASRLLPYHGLIVPFAYFFAHHARTPTGVTQKRLRDFFWRVSLSGRYSSAMENRVLQDIRERINKILDGEAAPYDFGVDVSPQALGNNGYFSVGRAYIKAMLCLLAQQKPRSFASGDDVNIQNDWLKQANSRNYHHFFPKSFLTKKGEEDFYINHIANITIVDDYLNKRVIVTKSPAVYIREFAGKNSDLEATLATHFVSLTQSGIAENDYDTFYKARLAAMSKALKKQLIALEIDRRGPTSTFDDYEPVTE